MKTNIEIHVADCTKPMAEIFRDSARKWRESAVYWAILAKECFTLGDTNRALFCALESRCRKQWALEDDARAASCMEVSPA